MKKFAAFDIDGTLIRWQLYHAVADELARRGAFDSIQYEKIRASRHAWKTRTSESAFNEYERALVNLVDLATSTISVDELRSVCQSVIREYKDQVYTYTRDLIVSLKKQDYTLFVISASQSEIVQLLAEYYGFDDYRGSEYEVKDGIYTGASHIMRSTEKPIALAELVAKHGLSYDESIAVGDSESDIPMLEAVSTPIAFNPTKALYEHARAAGWKIVVERKNVVYELS